MARLPEDLKGRLVAFRTFNRSTPQHQDRRPSGYRRGLVIRTYATRRGGLQRVTVQLAGGDGRGNVYTRYRGQKLTVYLDELQADECCGVLWFSKIRPLDEWLKNGSSA